MITIMKDTPSMPPVSIVIPLRIESTEREANLHCVLQYLLRSPFVYIDLLEADKERRFFSVIMNGYATVSCMTKRLFSTAPAT